MKNGPITCRGFVPDGRGGYRRVEEMTPEERADFGQRLVQRMGQALNDHYSSHPEDYMTLGGING